MARGDGAHFHFIMNVALQFVLPDPVFQERQNNARGDGFVTRSMVAFVQTRNDNNDRLEMNQAERRAPVIEQQAPDENPQPPVEPEELPLEPLVELDDFLLYDFESDDSEIEYSDGLEFSDLESDVDDANNEGRHSELELTKRSAV